MPARRLVRPQNRVLFGVCSGLGAYFGIDPTLVRILWVLFTIGSVGIGGVPLYFVLALIMPSATADDGITAAAPATPVGATLGGEIVEQVEGAIDRATSDAGGTGGGGSVA